MEKVTKESCNSLFEVIYFDKFELNTLSSLKSDRNKQKVIIRLQKMTTIFGFERQQAKDTHIPNGVHIVLDNLEVALTKTYEKRWQASGMGFILVGKDGARKFAIFKGYQGLKKKNDIRDNLPAEFHLAVSNNPRAVFGVLQNMPDLGKEEFLEHPGWEFPLESENWYVIIMGFWENDGFSDENFPWYNKIRPSLSIPQYLETGPEIINFNWIDSRRTPYIVAVRKDGQQIYVVDRYSDFNGKGLRYVREQADGIIYYQGVRNGEGNQV